MSESATVTQRLRDRTRGCKHSPPLERNWYETKHVGPGLTVVSHETLAKTLLRDDVIVIADHHQSRVRRLASDFRRRQMTTAMLDRLTHHCDIVETGNTS